MALPGTDILDRLLSVVPSPVIVADLRGAVLVFNKAAETALGYGAAEVRDHMRVTDLYHRADDARRVLRRLRTREAEGAVAPDPLDVTLRARNGELVPVRLTASIVHASDGEAFATLGLFEDRREEIALGRRLEDAALQIEASERRAASATAVGVAAHEMAQPLTAAMGNVEILLLDRTLAAPVRARLQKTYDQLDRLSKILRAVARSRAATSRDLAEEGA
jgi:PAS domain S-box-containing protein